MPNEQLAEFHPNHNAVARDAAIGLGADWHAFIDHLGPHLDGTKTEDRFEDLQERYASSCVV